MAAEATTGKKPYRVRELATNGDPYRGKVFHDDRERNEFGDLVLDDQGNPKGRCTYKAGETVLLTEAEFKQYKHHVVPV